MALLLHKTALVNIPIATPVTLKTAKLYVGPQSWLSKKSETLWLEATILQITLVF